MSQINKNPKEGKNKYYSISKKLKEEGRTNDEFEFMLGLLTFEEMIGLRLEIAARMIRKNKLYGVPIWNAIKHIVRDAMLKFVYSSTKSKNEAARFLGLKMPELYRYIKIYKPENYFEESNYNKE